MGSPGGPAVKTSLSNAEGAGSILVRKLRSHMFCSQKLKKKKKHPEHKYQKQYCTNSIKTLKMVHIKKKNLKRKKEHSKV